MTLLLLVSTTPSVAEEKTADVCGHEREAGDETLAIQVVRLEVAGSCVADITVSAADHGERRFRVPGDTAVEVSVAAGLGLLSRPGSNCDTIDAVGLGIVIRVPLIFLQAGSAFATDSDGFGAFQFNGLIDGEMMRCGSVSQVASLTVLIDCPLLSPAGFHMTVENANAEKLVYDGVLYACAQVIV